MNPIITKLNRFQLTVSLLTLFGLLTIANASWAEETYTFTNCGQAGREGPTQAQINTAYDGTNLAGKVTINTRGIQEWVVPAAGSYAIEAWGAQGGTSRGGLGTYIKGTFYLDSNDIINIVVGQRGNWPSNHESGGGGGGTFVWIKGNDDPKLIAGGGGGGGGGGLWSSSYRS